MQTNLQIFAIQQRTSIWDIWDFGQLPKVHSKKQSTRNKTKNNPIRKWAKSINRHFMEEGIQVANKLIMRKELLLVIRKIQVKTIMRYYYTLKNGGDKNAGMDEEKLDHSYFAGGNVK